MRASVYEATYNIQLGDNDPIENKEIKENYETTETLYGEEKGILYR